MSTRGVQGQQTKGQPTQVQPAQLTSAQLIQIVRRRFSGLAADLVCRMVSVLPGPKRVWNVRSAKARFAEMLAQVRKGEPQFLLREGDEEPVIFLSFETMHRLIQRGVVGQSFTERMAPFMRDTKITLTARDFGPRDHFTIPARETAPAGSDVAVAAVKSALAAANSAYDSFTKAAKRATEIAEANIAAASVVSKEKDTKKASGRG